MLKIVQVNVRHFYNNRNLIYDFLQQEDPDVALFNSTAIINNYKIRYYGYTSRQSADGAHRGVAILIKSTFKHSFLTDYFNHPDFLAVKVTTLTGPLIISTAYIRPLQNLPLFDFNKLFNNTHIPVIFAGDINACHLTYHHSQNNTHGHQLLAIATQKNLHYLGPDFFTFYNAGNKGRPDLVFGNRAALVYHTHLTPGPNIGSDHIPIIIKIATTPILNTERPAYNYKKANWDAFKTTLQNYNFDFELAGEDAQTLDRRWNDIFRAIVSTMLTTIPRSTHKIRNSFHKSIKTQRLLTCFRSRFIQNLNLNRLGLVQARLDLTYLKNHLLDSFLSDHNRFFQNLVNKAESERVRSPREFWQLIRKLKGNNNPSFDHLTVNNRFISDPEEVIKIFKDHWETVFHPHPPHPLAANHVHVINTWCETNRVEIAPRPSIDLTRLDENNELTAPITSNEVKQTIMRFPRKAPGSSQIGKDALSHLPDNLLHSITALYNASLSIGYFPSSFKTAIVVLIPKPQKDLSNVSSYRPISLLESLGKVFEKLINRRLRRYLDENNLISTTQFGFRSHRSTQDVLNIMLCYIKNNNDRRLKTILVTKDVERAFDTVWHAGLRYKICNNFNFPPLISKLLCSYLDNRKLKLKFLNHISETILMHAGVPQGGIISPTLYTIYTSDVPDTMFRDSLTLQYADDLTQLARHNTLSILVRRINYELDIVSRWEQLWRIKTNQQKTKVMFIKPRKKPPFDPVYLSLDRPQNSLSITNSCTVLGLTFDYNFRFHTHSKVKAAIGHKALDSLRRFRCAAPRTKVHLFKALVKPLLSYAPLALLMAAPTNQQKMQVVQNAGLRWILNVVWDQFKKTKANHEDANMLPLNQYWQEMVCKQLERLSTWSPDWRDKILTLSREGMRAGIATSLLDDDWQSLPPARY